MNKSNKITWVKRVLLFKMLVILLMWGLPTWLAPESILNLFGETLPDNPFYMRIFGAVQTAMIVLYWFAYKNPVHNRDIIRYAVVDNGLSFVTIIGFALTVGITNPTIWVSAVLVAFFAVAFYLLTPKAG